MGGASSDGSDHGSTAHSGGGEKPAICHLVEFACLDIRAHHFLILGLVVLVTFILQVLGRVVQNLESKVHDNPSMKRIFHAVMEELAITGMISFTLFFLKTFLRLDHTVQLYFEFVHLTLLVTVLFYVPFIGFLVKQRQWCVEEWELFEKLIQSNEESILQSLSPRQKLRFVQYSGVRSHFVVFHKLQPQFPFVRYINECFDLLFEKFTELGYKVGACMLLWLSIGWSLSPIFVPAESVEDLVNGNLYLFVAAIIVNYLLFSLVAVTLSKLSRMILYLQKESKLSREETRRIHLKSIQLNAIEENAELNEEISQLNMGSGLEEEVSSETSKTTFSPLQSTSSDSLASVPSVRHRPELKRTLLSTKIPARQVRSRGFLAKYLPLLFEKDPYRRLFPFAAPNSVLSLFQFMVVYQGLLLCLISFMFVYEDWSKQVYPLFLAIAPSVGFFIWIVPNSLPVLALVRYSGPLGKRKFIRKYEFEEYSVKKNDHKSAHQEH